MTAREIGVILEGETWRQRQAARKALVTAWQTAAFMRRNRLPNLKQMLSTFDSTVDAAGRTQTKEEVRAWVLDFAAANGLRVTRHEKLVM